MLKTKKPKRAQAKQPKASANGVHQSGDVLTLAEASAFLRITEAEVLTWINEQGLPARRVGNDWRLLKSAIEAWLSRSVPDTSKAAQLAVIGNWKDDPYVEEELKEIYRQRKASVIGAKP
jgi:excisionase family DNA binding protein